MEESRTKYGAWFEAQHSKDDIDKLLDSKNCESAYLLLKTHCLIETYIEARLKKHAADSDYRFDRSKNFGGKIIECRRQHLLPKEILAVLDRLHKARNELAHRFQAEITNEQVEFIVEPLGPDLAAERKKIADRATDGLYANVLQAMVQILMFAHVAVAFGGDQKLREDMARLAEENRP